jgi:lipoprotein-anchoring transpeptidase ErfK/SrfK
VRVADPTEVRRIVLLPLAVAAAAAGAGVFALGSTAGETARAAAIGTAAVHTRSLPRPRPAGTVVVHATRRLPLRLRPGGAIAAWVSQRTEFGSPQTLPVVARRGRWLAVKSTALPNDRAGWIPARDLRYSRVRVSLDVDLSSRTLAVARGARVLRRFTVGVGRADSSTPTGRFAVTDKLPGARYGAYFGCCILALSGHQPNLPPGWTGGDRLAIHGGPSSGAVSAGCLHAAEPDLRYLMRVVPLGALVTIHP